MFSKWFVFTHIRENGQKRCITCARPVAGTVTLLVNSTCREVPIICCIWCVSAVDCNIGEENQHFAEEVLETLEQQQQQKTSPLLCMFVSRLILKSTHRHVYIPNKYYGPQVLFSPQNAVVV